MKKSFDNSWQEYFKKTKGQAPRELLVKALAYVLRQDEALDLGASALNDTKYLLEEGFRHVTAVDKEPVAKEIALELRTDRFSYIISSFEDFEFPEDRYDIVNAQYALPFSSKKNFDSIFAKIKQSLVKDGIFVGQLFGERDERNTPSRSIIFQKKTEVEALLSDMEIIELFEQEKNDYTTLSLKPLHIHIFHIIARKQ